MEGYTRTVLARDDSCAEDGRAGRETGDSSGRFRSRQGLRKWRISCLVVGSGRTTAYPVIDRRHQTDRYFTRDRFRYEPGENAYHCPEGKVLSFKGHRRESQRYLYRSTEAQCASCPQKKSCTSGPYRRLFVARARVCPANRPRFGRNASLRAFAASSLQNRSSVCGTQATNAPASNATTPPVERK